MSNNSHLNTSGDGSRPATSGGVDNIGAADTFTPSKTPDSQQHSPAAAGENEAKAPG